MPLLQPENIWQESGRLEKYISEDVMFRCLTDKGNYCLAPTAEEAIVKYAKNRLTSYKQLPVTYFQIGEKFRNEIRTRGYLLRGKSFTMMDAYSFGRNQKDLDEEYENIKNITGEFKNLELKRNEIYTRFPENLKEYYEPSDVPKGLYDADILYKAFLEVEKKLNL